MALAAFKAPSSMNLHTAGHRRGVVCAPHAATVEDGRHILAEGGNAIEAMIAMAASIAAVYPHMNHVGGDGFWLIREPSGRVRAIMGAGRAGAKATRQFYRDVGHHEIPARGPLAALTVPGAVAGWMLALEAAKAQTGKGTHAKLPLDVLFEAAIRHAREGYAVMRSQAKLTVDKYVELETAPGFMKTFLVDGKAPEAGVRLKQTAFAATLEQLAQAGLDDFYRGDVGREIAADLERIGSPVTRTDLEKFEAKIAEPLSVPITAGTLYNTPPPTQGLASLMILALFDRLRVGKGEGFEHVHGLVEATKRAFRVRDRFVTDPDQIDGNLTRFLAPAYLDAEAAKIDARKAARWPAPYGEGDTVWMGAADASGLVVSYIQSLYWEFGSGCVLPATGVLMQNRGASFSLDPRAVNALEAGRRPFHTLNPALATLKDGRVMGYGAMGGDGQPQSQAAVFSRYISFGQPLELALDAPRWLLGRTWGSNHTNLRLESRFKGELVDRLMSVGHDVEMLDEAYSDTMGHAGAVILHPNGTLEGGHDPRADGGAAGV
jgi:gamma-glutamyltranspeptidase